MSSRVASPDADRRPLVAHVVYRFAVGGLENGVANLIERMPADAFRHAVIALTEVTDFKRRIERDDVDYFSLHKPAGHGVRVFPALFRLFRALAPAIVHTRNLAALEASLPAWAARVPIRIHGEHGWEASDLEGRNRRYRLIRRAYRPFVGHYVALSQHIESYLQQAIGIPAERVTQIHNGVDTERFAPGSAARSVVPGFPFTDSGLWVVGTVGRMDRVKDQVTLAHAFARAVTSAAAARRMRLVLVGDGPLREAVEAALRESRVRELAWLPGERPDVAAILRSLDCFVLPSLAEGISNTILEAMATALPVVATRVGGNAELVEDGMTGRLVPPADADAMATALLDYFNQPDVARRHGKAGRRLVEKRFSLTRMAGDYERLYTRLLAERGLVRAGFSAA
jgi:sugar transferase (PEP-CTERM/EpsH1 system associated)